MNENIIIPAIFILLLVSILLHVYYIVQFILKRRKKDMSGFFNTAITNIVMAGGLTFMALYRPDLIQKINTTQLMWIISGVMMTATIIAQVMVFRNIYRRSKDPAHYHLNFFGRKVLHSSVVRPEEIVIFFFVMPFVLFCGAYFVARLINMIMYGHL